MACTLFRLLTGRDPFAGADRAAVATAHLGQPVPSVRAVHPYLSPEVDAVMIGLDAETGAPSWPVVDLHDAPVSCAVHENRIGCVASASNGSDSSIFILDADNGNLLKR